MVACLFLPLHSTSDRYADSHSALTAMMESLRKEGANVALGGARDERKERQWRRWINQWRAWWRLRGDDRLLAAGRPARVEQVTP